MDRLEKLIYSVKYLPQILYFGSAGLILLDIFIDIELIGDKLRIPLWILFFYMTYLGSKNYKSGDVSLEKFIYSIKYLPQVLYFGSVAWIIYTLYFGDYLENEIQIFGYAWDDSLLKELFFFWFLYITYLAVKNLKTKDGFGGNK